MCRSPPAGRLLSRTARRGCGRALRRVQGIQQPARQDHPRDYTRLGGIPTLFRSVRPGDGGPTGTTSSRRSFTRSLTFTPYAPLPETVLAPPGATPVRETP